MIAKFKKQKKNRFKKEVIFQAVFFILVSFLIGFLFVSNLKINKKRTELIKRIESLREEIQILEEEKQKLESAISQTEKDSYWEEIVREQGYIRTGENPVVVVPPAEAQEEPKIDQNFSEKLLESLKSLFARIIQW